MLVYLLYERWRRHPDLNWGIRVLQTRALPLGYDAIYEIDTQKAPIKCFCCGADDGARTRYLHLGKVALYQMSYIRILCRSPKNGASGRNRTNDTGIFSPLLYRLSYRGISAALKCSMAIRMGFEPTTSSVTGWHSNQLNYRTACGGHNRARTYDPLLVRQMLSQLSYDPMNIQLLIVSDPKGVRTLDLRRDRAAL